MRCPACGAFYKERSARCPECGAVQDEVSQEIYQQNQPEAVLATVAETIPQASQPKPKRRAIRTNPSLLEFPGVNRAALPEWRKEVAERVREVQEKRAREAALESGEPLFSELEAKTAPGLALLAQADAPPLNPIVVAALRRIERAHAQPLSNAVCATAVAYDEPELALELNPAEENNNAPTAKPERVHNLAVVPMPAIPQIEPAETEANELITSIETGESASLSETSEVAPEPETIKVTKKPRRIIDDRNDPALNYLDSVPTTITVDRREYCAAPIFLRILGGLTDLLIAALLSSPILALTQLTKLEWRSPRVIGFAAATFVVVGFLYLTVSIAFTGRTLGMKVFSLRVVDARTGMIPTGGQAAGRALVYMLSLAAGLPLIYPLVNSEKYSAHDRVTRTAVIRV
jgi:uncharacterized RDD family membrane protein YckC